MKSKRFVLLALVLLVGVGCLVSVAQAATPVWKISWIILPEINYTHPDGQRIVTAMTEQDLSVAKMLADRVEQFIEQAAAGAVDIQMDVFVSSQSVTTLSELS